MFDTGPEKNKQVGWYKKLSAYNHMTAAHSKLSLVVDKLHHIIRIKLNYVYYSHMHNVQYKFHSEMDHTTILLIVMERVLLIDL
jgi:hypothetical protein